MLYRCLLLRFDIVSAKSMEGVQNKLCIQVVIMMTKDTAIYMFLMP